MRFSFGTRGGGSLASLARGVLAATIAASGPAAPLWAQIGVDHSAPSALQVAGEPVDWLFVFKLNAAQPGANSSSPRPCTFGGTPQPYSQYNLAYLWASSLHPELQQGPGNAGDGPGDPLGATFAEIYAHKLHYVVWNDQLYRHPRIAGCGDSCGSPWGHSKGVLAWNELGEGVVIQVTTPSWPAAASAFHPRQGDGNTLGCVDDNNVKVSQDFFAVRLTRGDVGRVVDALANSSVVTDVANPILADNGGPSEIASKVATLGRKSRSTQVIDVLLSTGIRLISKPSALHVPPWQLVSSVLGGIDLRTATWWANPTIPSTTGTTVVDCWDPALTKPGAVQIATTGNWNGPIGLRGGLPADSNHAKIGVSVSGKANYTIFGDLNQQGSLSGRCDSSQNGRGGMFFVVDNAALNMSVGSLISPPATQPTAPQP